jgi:tetratricopeptide (TPR) repeat protein
MRRHATLDEHAFTNVVLSFFNTILGWDSTSSVFWHFGLRDEVEQYFGEGVLDDIPENASMRDKVDMYLLFKRVQQLTGVKLTDQAMKELKQNPNSFYLVSPDIEKMSVRVKHMNITSLAEANSLAIEALNQLEEAIRLTPGLPTPHHERLFRLAMNKFEQAIRSTPDNLVMLNHYADVLERLALLKAGAGQEAFTYFERAYERYLIAKNFEGLMHLGDELRELQAHWNERERIFELANKCYSEATAADRLNAEAFYRWGDLLVKYAKTTGTDFHYSRAGSSFKLKTFSKIFQKLQPHRMHSRTMGS